jgi:hypothetical protein
MCYIMFIKLLSHSQILFLHVKHMCAMVMRAGPSLMTDLMQGLNTMRNMEPHQIFKSHSEQGNSVFT